MSVVLRLKTRGIWEHKEPQYLRSLIGEPERLDRQEPPESRDPFERCRRTGKKSLHTQQRDRRPPAAVVSDGSSAGWAFGAATSLLPLAKRVHADLDRSGEVGLCQAYEASSREGLGQISIGVENVQTVLLVERQSVGKHDQVAPTRVLCRWCDKTGNRVRCVSLETELLRGSERCRALGADPVSRQLLVVGSELVLDTRVAQVDKSP